MKQLAGQLGAKQVAVTGMFFHSKSTWGYATLRGILSWTSSLAKGILFCNFSLGEDMLFGDFGQRQVKFWRFLCTIPKILLIFA